MERIVINPKGLKVDNTWLEFRKVRGVIENSDGMIILSKEGGKYIFPGGKCDYGETELDAIKREIKEEAGIEILDNQLEKVLEIEAYYDDFWDYRSSSYKPRHTITTYFKIITDKEINLDEQNLTDGEIKESFNIFTCNLTEVNNYLCKDHSDVVNGKFFDEENKIVMEEILCKKNH